MFVLVQISHLITGFLMRDSVVFLWNQLKTGMSFSSILWTNEGFSWWLGLGKPILIRSCCWCLAWNGYASNIMVRIHWWLSNKRLETLPTSVQNRIVTSFNYWLIQGIALSLETSSNQLPDSFLIWVLYLAQDLSCNQGWCFSLKLYFSCVEFWSVNKNNFEIVR